MTEKAITIKIYNTLTRKKDEFESLFPGQVCIYVCGPKVYSQAHIGHAMSALVFDKIRQLKDTIDKPTWQWNKK